MSLAGHPQDELWWRLRDLGGLGPERRFGGTKEQPPVPWEVLSKEMEPDSSPECVAGERQATCCS